MAVGCADADHARAVSRARRRRGEPRVAAAACLRAGDGNGRGARQTRRETDAAMAWPRRAVRTGGRAGPTRSAAGACVPAARAARAQPFQTPSRPRHGRVCAPVPRADPRARVPRRSRQSPAPRPRARAPRCLSRVCRVSVACPPRARDRTAARRGASPRKRPRAGAGRSTARAISNFKTPREICRMPARALSAPRVLSRLQGREARRRTRRAAQRPGLPPDRVS